MRVEEGGPGESPGRDEAVRRARERTASRLGGKPVKIKKGSNSRKPGRTVGRERARKLGL